MNYPKSILSFLMMMAMLIPGVASSKENTAISTVGVQGYDLVGYHTEGKPVKGNGHYLAVHDGTTYLFVSESNQKTFEANPAKYLPAYGGYCAYGVSVGKKFVGDPKVWKLVDGRLYLNLDKDIQTTWKKDIPGNIVKAENNWPKIKDTAPGDL